MDQEKIGRFIAETRNQAGMTQKELAGKIGISDKTISKWECGKSMPDITYLEPLCDSLAISMNELISGERLSDTAYSPKAEENIMSLMKENQKAKKGATINIIIGAVLAILACVLMFAVNQDSGGTVLSVFTDATSVIILALINAAAVLLSRAKTFHDVLEVLAKVSVPSGALVTLCAIVIVIALTGCEDAQVVGVNIAVALLALIYSIVEYLVVTVIKGCHTDKE